jgi:hypothetical protein
MMTAWTQVESDGSIADLPASEFRYQYQFIIDTDSLGPMLGFYTGMDTALFDLTWQVQIIDPGGMVIFDQVVRNQIMFVSLAGLLFKSQFVDSSERIITTVASSPLSYGTLAAAVSTAATQFQFNEVVKGWPATGRGYLTEANYIAKKTGPSEINQEAIGYAYATGSPATMSNVQRALMYGPFAFKAGDLVRQAPPTLEAEQGIGIIDDSTSPIITGKWMSPVYQFPIPAGSKFKIIFHNAGMAALSKSLNAVQTSVQKANANATPFLYLEETGTWVEANAKGAGTQVQASVGLQALNVGTLGSPFFGWSGLPETTIGLIPAPVLTTAVPLRRGMNSSELLVVGQAGNAVYIAHSPRLGAQDTWSTPMVVAQTGTLLGACLDDTGGTLYLLVNDGGYKTLAVALGLDANGNLTVSDTSERPCVTITDAGQGTLQHVGAGLQTLLFKHDRLYFLSDDGTVKTLWVSTDGGSTWRA